MNDDLEFIEIQGTGEEKSFSKEEFNGFWILPRAA